MSVWLGSPLPLVQPSMDLLFSPYTLPWNYIASALQKPWVVPRASNWDGTVGNVSPSTLVLHPTQFTATFLDTWIRYSVAKPIQNLAFKDAFNHINDALAASWQPPNIAGKARVGLFPPSSLLALDLAAKHKDELNSSHSNVLLVLRRVNIYSRYLDSDRLAVKDFSYLVSWIQGYHPVVHSYSDTTITLVSVLQYGPSLWISTQWTMKHRKDQVFHSPCANPLVHSSLTFPVRKPLSFIIVLPSWMSILLFLHNEMSNLPG